MLNQNFSLNCTVREFSRCAVPIYKAYIGKSYQINVTAVFKYKDSNLKKKYDICLEHVSENDTDPTIQTRVVFQSYSVGGVDFECISDTIELEPKQNKVFGTLSMNPELYMNLPNTSLFFTLNAQVYNRSLKTLKTGIKNYIKDQLISAIDEVEF